MSWLLERKVKAPRVWSNRELSKFAGLFQGSVINVSAWKDIDKQGKKYADYFTSSQKYYISNHLDKEKGFKDALNSDYIIDLEADLPDELLGKFQVVFNHTVLEHVFEVEKAFSNLSKLTSDVLIVVVPFLQHQHSAYGDYWRFTPEGVSKLFEKNGLRLIYINYNDEPNQSVYVFAIGAKKPQQWDQIKNTHGNKIERFTEKVGNKLVKQNFLFMLKVVILKIISFLKSFFNRI